MFWWTKCSDGHFVAECGWSSELTRWSKCLYSAWLHTEKLLLSLWEKKTEQKPEILLGTWLTQTGTACCPSALDLHQSTSNWERQWWRRCVFLVKRSDNASDNNSADPSNRFHSNGDNMAAPSEPLSLTFNHSSFKPFPHQHPAAKPTKPNLFLFLLKHLINTWSFCSSTDINAFTFPPSQKNNHSAG